MNNAKGDQSDRDVLIAECLSQAELLPPSEHASFVRNFFTDDEEAVNLVLGLLSDEKKGHVFSELWSEIRPRDVHQVDGTGDTPDNLGVGTEITNSQSNEHPNDGDSSPMQLPDIPGHRLTRVLGEGGMGIVVEGFDEGLQVNVAIKLMRGGLVQSHDARKRFLNEARAVAKLRHPNVVGVLREGETDQGILWFSMEHVEGKTLDKLVPRGGMDIDQVIDIVCDVAKALACAHSANILHRDIKPANVLIDKNGQVKVVDFGLAKNVQTPEDVTKTGHAVGTPQYMAPEQLDASIAGISAATDIYAIGVLLYNLLTGTTPFRFNQQFDLLHAILQQPPQPPKQIRRIVPLDLNSICLKCLEKHPLQRYGSAEELIDDLERFKIGQPVTARPIGFLQRGFRWTKRKPLIASLFALAAVLILTLAVVIPVAYFKTNAASGMAYQRAIQATEAAKKGSEALEDMKTVYGLTAAEKNRPSEAALWFADVARTATEWRFDASMARFRSWVGQSPIPIRALQLQEEIIGLLLHPEGRFLLTQNIGNRWRLWNMMDEQEIDSISSWGQVTAAAWHPNGTQLAIADSTGGVRLLQLPEWNTVAEMNCGGPIFSLAFDKLGESIAVAGRHAFVWDLDPDGVVTKVHDHDRLAYIKWGPNGRYLATVSEDGHANVFALNEHRVNAKAALTVACQARPVWFFDEGRKLLTVASERITEIWEIESGKRLETIAGPGILQHLAASIDGTIFGMTGNGWAELWDENAQKIGGDLTHSSHVFGSTFSPDCRLYVTCCDDHLVRIWSTTSGELLAQIPHQSPVRFSEFAADNRHFVTAESSGLIRLWSLPQGPGARHLATVGDDHKVVLSLSGEFAVAAGWWKDRKSTSTTVYQVTSGKPASPVLDAHGLINGGAFSPDDTILVLLHTNPGDVRRTYGTSYRWEEHEGKISFFDWKKGEQSGSSITTPSEPIDGAFDPVSGLLVVGCAGGEILVVDPTKRRIQAELDAGGHASGKYGFKPHRWIVFRKSGTCFASVGFGDDEGSTERPTGAGTVQIWDVFGNLLQEIRPAGIVRDVTFSPDGNLVAVASYNSVQIFNVSTGQQVSDPMTHPDWVFTVCFSPNGDSLLTSCRDWMARFWNWRTGTLVCPALEHDDEVFDARVTADGKSLMTVSGDGFVRAWDSTSGKLAMPAMRISAIVGSEIGIGHQIEITPDGNHLIVGGKIGDMDVFEIQTLHQTTNEQLKTVGREDQVLLAEIMAGKRIVSIGTVELSDKEWFDRWMRFRKLYPTLPRLCVPSYDSESWQGRELNRQRRNQLYKLGEMHFERSEFESVLRCFDKILGQPSSPPNINSQIGVCFFGLERWADAEMAFSNAIAINEPDSRRLHEFRGYARLAQRDFKGAQSDLNRVWTTHNTNVFLTLALAIVYSAQNDSVGLEQMCEARLDEVGEYMSSSAQIPKSSCHSLMRIGGMKGNNKEVCEIIISTLSKEIESTLEETEFEWSDIIFLRELAGVQLRAGDKAAARRTINLTFEVSPIELQANRKAWEFSSKESLPKGGHVKDWLRMAIIEQDSDREAATAWLAKAVFWYETALMLPKGTSILDFDQKIEIEFLIQEARELLSE
ncbi:Serine/threonine-protein kinase PknB [Planctomycetes bacterium CA13]|uniref:non-specific serine/threonine protein kinase n=1 Tax=Novipirellula herctigrandis TaxID=2527986 RepID=A0A5C5Z886_9BACT|nr:Serine/threonine-protein kinase PknB [Planctomycetes bacterium CA13]